MTHQDREWEDWFAAQHEWYVFKWERTDCSERERSLRAVDKPEQKEMCTQQHREILSQAVKWWKRRRWKFNYKVLRHDKVNWGNSKPDRYCINSKGRTILGWIHKAESLQYQFCISFFCKLLIWPWIKSLWLSQCHSFPCLLQQYSLWGIYLERALDTFIINKRDKIVHQHSTIHMFKASWNGSDICRKPHLGGKESRGQLWRINLPWSRRSFAKQTAVGLEKRTPSSVRPEWSKEKGDNLFIQRDGLTYDRPAEIKNHKTILQVRKSSWDIMLYFFLEEQKFNMGEFFFFPSVLS